MKSRGQWSPEGRARPEARQAGSAGILPAPRATARVLVPLRPLGRHRIARDFNPSRRCGERAPLVRPRSREGLKPLAILYRPWRDEEGAVTGR